MILPARPIQAELNEAEQENILRGQDWADIIDFLTMYPEARRRAVRALGELTAKTDP